GSHWEAVERGEAHGALQALPRMERAHRGSAAEMSHDNAALGDVRRELRQLARDVFVGESVKAVAADALLVEPLGQRVAVGDLWMAAMEGGVEAGDLGELRLPLQQGSDGAEIVRLMEWRKRRKSLESLDHGCVDQNRRTVIRTAMHHAVSDRDGQASDLGAQELNDLAERGRHVGGLGRRPGLVDENFAFCVLGSEPWLDANPLDLPLQATLQLIVRVDLEQLKLNTRAAGVDDENGVGHGPHAWIGSFAIWLWRKSAATAQEAMRVRTLSAREVRMIGTRAPSTMPAASACERKLRFLASMLPASRSGTTRICACPATGEAMPLIRAASGLIALSKASGPSSSPPVICPRSAILHSAAASMVEGIVGVTVSTAERMATFGVPRPSPAKRSMAF